MNNYFNIFWFRRDLRLEDNAGLMVALEKGLPVIPIFIFDRHILNGLPVNDLRVQFIHQEVLRLQGEIRESGSEMLVFHGTPEEVFPALISEYNVRSIIANRDYEPYAKTRDNWVANFARKENVDFLDVKDHVIFDRDEILKDDGKPYTVFTPYKRKWLTRVNLGYPKTGDRPEAFRLFPSSSLVSALWQTSMRKDVPSLGEMGFESQDFHFPERSVPRKRIMDYDKTRDYPGIEGTSRLGIHFRFGTISVREKAWHASRLNETYLSELIWRDFYAMILDHFPRVVDQSFRPEYDRINWRNDPEDFKKWCSGKTGYPMVDAGMRELNKTGYMHNRVRMVTASFLTKHLLIDWRKGEAYFAEKLLDYDLASNNGGWQWAAGSGTDAAPYFRIFNPESQLQKFDKDLSYVKKWVPEYGTASYPRPMVDHKFARERCLKVYQEALKGSN